MYIVFIQVKVFQINHTCRSFFRKIQFTLIHKLFIVYLNLWYLYFSVEDQRLVMSFVWRTILHTQEHTDGHPQKNLRVIYSHSAAICIIQSSDCVYSGRKLLTGSDRNLTLEWEKIPGRDAGMVAGIMEDYSLKWNCNNVNPESATWQQTTFSQKNCYYQQLNPSALWGRAKLNGV